jgi:manganese/zinc/iron transport system permease protein
VIVLAGSLLFVVSILFGTRRGVLVRWIQRRIRDRRIARDHLLRAMFDCIEPHLSSETDLQEQLRTRNVTRRELLERRSWSPARLSPLVRSAERDGYVVDFGDAGVQLTEMGANAACRVVRNHRLWELYLIEFADRSPNRVDRDADDIEHDLGPEIVGRLERLLAQKPRVNVPPSPHEIVATPDGVAK